MAVLSFPDIEESNPEGLLAVGGDLEIPSLIMAYSQGIFPWPISEEHPLAWFSPDPRGILYCKDLHVSKSFKKVIAKNDYEIKFNTRFSEVIRNCADITNRKDQDDTWITDEMVQAYEELFDIDHAFSVEIMRDENLIGGLYGVCIGQFVAGESMFHREDNASKLALWALIEHLKSCRITWLDTQMITPVIRSMGGTEINRKTYKKLLQSCVNEERPKELFKI